MGEIHVFSHNFLFLRYYHVKIQFIVSFEYTSQFSATVVVKYSYLKKI